MMRLRRKTREAPKQAVQMPMAEDIISLGKEGRRDWKSMSDDAVIAFAKKFMGERGITGKKELQKTATGLYKALSKRKLLDEVGFETRRRSWAAMSDDEILTHAQKRIEEKGVVKRTDLEQKDSGLYIVLRERNLLEGVKFKGDEKRWSRYSDDGLVAHAQSFADANGLGSKTDLENRAGGLCDALRKRNLIDRIKFERNERAWRSYSDDELVAHAQKLVDEKGIRNRSNLARAEAGLYEALNRRKLSGRIKFKGDERRWCRYSDDELVAHAQKLVDEKGLRNATALHRAESGLCAALMKRELLGRFGFEERYRKTRNWASISDDEIVAFSKRVMEEKGITGRSELKNTDPGLYVVLRNRKLIDRIGLEEKQRHWALMSDDELVEFAKKFMEEKGITRTGELHTADSGLCFVLRIRNLLSRVFAPLEAEKRKQAVQQVFDGLKEFGDKE